MGIDTTDDTQQLVVVNESDAARRLGKKAKTLANWRNKGIGPAFVTTPEGRFLGYRPAALEEWAMANEVQSTAQARKRAGRKPRPQPRGQAEASTKR